MPGKTVADALESPTVKPTSRFGEDTSSRQALDCTTFPNMKKSRGPNRPYIAIKRFVCLCDTSPDMMMSPATGAQKERRVGPPLFDVIIELEGGGEGARPMRWTVVTNVGDVVDELLADGRVPRPEFRAPLGDDDLLVEVGARVGAGWTSGAYFVVR